MKFHNAFTSVGRVAGIIALATISLAGCRRADQAGATGEKAQSPVKSDAPGGASATVDACALLSQEDATGLFGKPASPQKGSPVFDTHMIGECLWTWDTEQSNQLLQFRVWNGAMYYGTPPSDSQPIDLGEKGYIRIHPVAGVDVQWLQKGKTISLSYSTIGKEVPGAATRAEDVKNLARKIAGQM